MAENVHLDEYTRELIFEGKHYLQKNDLAGFYDWLKEVIEQEGSDAAIAAGEITWFLGTKGITFDRFMDYIPAYGCCNDGAPDQWSKTTPAGAYIISVPEKIKYIHEEAFDECIHTRQIEILGVQKIGDVAFANCRNLEVVKVGPNLNTIGEAVFYGCSKLRNIYIPDNGNSYLTVKKHLLHENYNRTIDIVDYNTGEVYETIARK